MTENNINDKHEDTSDVLSLLQTIDHLYRVSCSVLNDHTQTSLRMSIAIEAQMLLSKLQAMNRRWRIHLPFKEACQVDFFKWSERMSLISHEMEESATADAQRRFEMFCPSKHFLLDLYAVLTDKDDRKEKPYYEETDVTKFLERQELMHIYVADRWKEYVTEVSDKTIEDLAAHGGADIILSADASFVRTVCCKVLEELSEALYALNQRLTTPISRKDFARLADRIRIERDYGGHFAFLKAKAKVNTWRNNTPYDRIESERDELIQSTIEEIRKTRYGGLFMQNINIYSDYSSQKASFGKFLFSVRERITKEELSQLFELIFRIHHLRQVTDKDEQETEDEADTNGESSVLSLSSSTPVNPPLPEEFSQNFRHNPEAVAKFYELLRKAGPYIGIHKKSAGDDEKSKYMGWKWFHLKDALVHLKLLISDVSVNTFAYYINKVFPDRSYDSVKRALYRTDRENYHAITGNIVRYFQPVADIVKKSMSENTLS